MSILSLTLLAAALGALAVSASAAGAPGGARDLPRIVEKDGRHALIVDGAPYLMLGIQANNSSAWPAMLPKVWPAAAYVHANTVELPVYWEQLEPEQGRFDYSVVDALLSGAREHHLKLVLLWFGTWKNGSSHYMPLWMKADPARYPRMIGKDGRRVDSPSPFSQDTLHADIAAFTALMRHLRDVDHGRTVLMVQVENEPGTWGSVRDHSPVAEEAFRGAVPTELLIRLGRPDSDTGRSWTDVFGADADEFFHAWSVAHFIGQVAAAGKAVYPLPLYVNAALRDPLNPGPAGTYESGGPTDNVMDIWKAAAPAIDLLAPDIYLPDDPRYLKVLELYGRPDNALFVPETGSSAAYARYCFAAVGRGAIGFSPFGIDYTGSRHAPYDDAAIRDWLGPFALDYRALGPISREIARLNFEGAVQGVCERQGVPTERIDAGDWTATVSYGVPGFGHGGTPQGNHEPIGRALVARLDADTFLVTAFYCRVDFTPKDGARHREFLRVEEGSYVDGTFQPLRIWNGDQTDWGLNFAGEPVVLRVRLGTY